MGHIVWSVKHQQLAVLAGFFILLIKWNLYA